MKKKDIKIIIIFCVLILFIVDRYTYMPERVKGKTWLNESGRSLGDPIAYKWNFILNGSEIIFINFKDKQSFPKIYRNTQSKFYLLGCYLGKLYILDKTRKEIIVYADE